MSRSLNSKLGPKHATGFCTRFCSDYCATVSIASAAFVAYGTCSRTFLRSLAPKTTQWHCGWLCVWVRVASGGKRALEMSQNHPWSKPQITKSGHTVSTHWHVPLSCAVRTRHTRTADVSADADPQDFLRMQRVY